MSNSNLVEYIKISPNKNSPRNNIIKKITIHHMAGALTAEQCANEFNSTSRRASCNYCVDKDARIGLIVEEKDRSWCSSNAYNDNQAVTIEVANDGREDTDWHISDKCLEKTIELCVDICKRNKIEKLEFTGDSTGNLTYHSMFAATVCPGGYLKSKFSYIANEVNRKLSNIEETVIIENTSNIIGKKFKSINNILFSSAVNAKDNTSKLNLSKSYNGKEMTISKTYYNNTVIAANSPIIGFFRVDNINIIDSSSNVSNGLKKGDSVKVVNGSKTYDSKNLAGFVFNNIYTIIEIKNDRVVIGKNNNVTCSINKNNIYKV